MTGIEKIIVVVLGLISVSLVGFIIHSWTSQRTAAAPVAPAANTADLSAKVNASLIDDAHAAVRIRLRDPGSAQFQDGFIIGTGNKRTLCGIVNAKNGFGGYSGYAPFIYREPSKSAELGGDNDSTFKINMSCTDQKSAEMKETLTRLKAWAASLSKDEVHPDLQKEMDEARKEIARMKAWADRY